MEFQLWPFVQDAEYGEGIVPLADMKAHLQVLEDDFDELIPLLRDAAIDMVERYCGLRLAPCTGLQWQAEALPDPVTLGVWPVTAITAVTWLDSAGDDVTGTAANWRIGLRDKVRLKPGATAPSGVAGGVVITFDAGFADAERPAALVQAVKMFTAHLFENRSAAMNGTISGEIPLGFRALCDRYRMPVI
jgi:uncharacterized phiE125 gp8 family phage protein